QPGAVSDVVETPFGFHLVKLEEHREAKVKPLAAVRDEIVTTLKNEGGMDRARKQAEADRGKLVRGTPFAEAVAGRTVEETPPFSAGADVPGVGRVKDFTETALGLSEHEPSDLIETEQAVRLLVPFGRSEAHTPPLADVRARVLADVRRERGEAAAKERGEKLLARAKEVGLAQAAGESGLAVDESGAFDRRTAAIPKLGTA